MTFSAQHVWNIICSLVGRLGGTETVTPVFKGIQDKSTCDPYVTACDANLSLHFLLGSTTNQLPALNYQNVKWMDVVFLCNPFGSLQCVPDSGAIQSVYNSHKDVLASFGLAFLTGSNIRDVVSDDNIRLVCRYDIRVLNKVSPCCVFKLSLIACYVLMNGIKKI